MIEVVILLRRLGIFPGRFNVYNSSLVRHLETGPGVVAFIVLNPCARSDNRALRIVTSFVVGAIELVEVYLFDLVSHSAHFKNVAYFQVVTLRSEQELTRMPPGFEVLRKRMACHMRLSFLASSASSSIGLWSL